MKVKYKRDCPSCGIVLYYSCSQSKRHSEKANATCKKCAVKRVPRSHPLLNLTIRDLTFYYWLGFVLADGHISNNRLIVTLSSVDEDHMKKFSDYLKVPYTPLIKKSHVKLAAQNKEVIGGISQEFNINPNKTEKPPDTSFYDKLNKKELLSLFAGFVDGDGSIGNLHKRRDFHLRIKCHSAWFYFLMYLNNRLDLKGNVGINNQGYSTLAITNTVFLKSLKVASLKLNIPLLSRKWDKINLDYIGRNELAEIRKLTVSTMLSKGFKVTEIADHLKVKSPTVSQIIKRNNFKNENITRTF